ncbi:MAG: hypothetical protein HY000_10520 [Planctomycetes bacterium]|nr:hypothetical protein [Planctomycetota bacterium]
MRLCPCRFNLPLTDNNGEPIAAEVILDLQRELLTQFGGYTIHPTSKGRWQSRGGRVYQEEVVVYEVAVPEEKVPLLREIVVRIGWRLGQLAVYFDAPPPSVDIIELTRPPGSTGGVREKPGQAKTTRRRSKRDRPSG